jgi:hypothetical protein
VIFVLKRLINHSLNQLLYCYACIQFVIIALKVYQQKLALTAILQLSTNKRIGQYFNFQENLKQALNQLSIRKNFDENFNSKNKQIKEFIETIRKAKKNKIEIKINKFIKVIHEDRKKDIKFLLKHYKEIL